MKDPVLELVKVLENHDNLRVAPLGAHRGACDILGLLDEAGFEVREKRDAPEEMLAQYERMENNGRHVITYQTWMDLPPEDRDKFLEENGYLPPSP